MQHKTLIDKTKNRENVPNLEVVEVLLFQCQCPNKSYAYLLNVEPSNLVVSKTYNTEFDAIIEMFSNENGRPLEIEYKVYLILFINE